MFHPKIKKIFIKLMNGGMWKVNILQNIDPSQRTQYRRFKISVQTIFFTIFKWLIKFQQFLYSIKRVWLIRIRDQILYFILHLNFKDIKKKIVSWSLIQHDNVRWSSGPNFLASKKKKKMFSRHTLQVKYYF